MFENPILAIDTVTEQCSVAVTYGENHIQLCESAEKSHSRHILSMVHDVLKQADLNLSSLAAIAVNIGPGSFTGVRIGIGVAQGLAYAIKIPVFSFCSLETLAFEGQAGTVLSALDARMGQVYYAQYEVSANQRPQLLVDPVVIDPTSVPFPPQSPFTCVGNGWEVYQSKFESLGFIESSYNPNLQLPEAKSMLCLGQMMSVDDAIDPLNLTAYYVRNEVAKKSSK